VAGQCNRSDDNQRYFVFRHDPTCCAARAVQF
jgi:hypothetical protein